MPRSNASHLCSVDEVIARLTELRKRYGNVGVMVCFDDEVGEGSYVPYMPVNGVAIDDDDLSKPVVLLCIAEGNHPFGQVVNIR